MSGNQGSMEKRKFKVSLKVSKFKVNLMIEAEGLAIYIYFHHKVPMCLCGP